MSEDIPKENKPSQTNKYITWGSIAAALFTILSWAGTQTWYYISAKIKKIDQIELQLVIMQQKANEDEAQWKLLKEYSDKLESIKIQQDVNKIIIDKFSMDLSLLNHNYESNKIKNPDNKEVLNHLNNIINQSKKEDTWDQFREQKIQEQRELK